MTVANARPPLTPLLVVRDAASAIDFYIKGVGAKETARYLHPTKDTISHADLDVAGSGFSVSEEAPQWNNDAPPTLGGSPVILQLQVPDAAAVCASMCELGATVVFPLQEFAGERMCRLRDPFGHLWLLRERLEELSDEEVRRRRAAWKPTG
jgi:PhnB protein